MDKGLGGGMDGGMGGNRVREGVWKSSIVCDECIGNYENWGEVI